MPRPCPQLPLTCTGPDGAGRPGGPCRAVPGADVAWGRAGHRWDSHHKDVGELPGPGRADRRPDRRPPRPSAHQTGGGLRAVSVSTGHRRGSGRRRLHQSEATSGGTRGRRPGTVVRGVSWGVLGPCVPLGGRRPGQAEQRASPPRRCLRSQIQEDGSRGRPCRRAFVQKLHLPGLTPPGALGGGSQQRSTHVCNVPFTVKRCGGGRGANTRVHRPRHQRLLPDVPLQAQFPRPCWEELPHGSDSI